MTRNYQIAPSILSADFSCLREQIQEAESHGASLFHIDAMDGHFVPNLTMGPFVVEACRRTTKMPLEVHLMIESPERFLADFAKAGARRLIVHVETGYHLHRTLNKIKELDCEAGVALNPATPVMAIEPVLHMVDLVLVMTINPGFSGQKFLPETLPKISKIRSLLDDGQSNAVIEVDGGINEETISWAREAGADIFVSATAVFKHPEGIGAGMQALLDRLP